ncbi:LysR family transcriptional regulator [Desulfoluna limicola]|uniref:LysR family transcriptional regulator n=1 Tax=Desulfoluna limicola TaxID=2810562 RepID=A0ABN6F7A1_9BACT|nr:LysR family transcriptional regulator [Desulfoluna limicola]BCS97192.1 LysR family transcriptional regulator [Desulfoluna limicola]
MLPDFNRLKVFYYIYSHCSVVDAAKALHLSQPAVSQQLQKLERELRTRLFTRLHRKLVPTAAGKELFDMVAPFVEGLETGVERLRRPSGEPSGVLRVGAPNEFGKQYLPRVCHAFRKEYPGVTFAMTFAESAIILGMLQEGRLDLALSDVFVTHDRVLGLPDSFSMEPLVEEEVILACSKGYYEAEIGGDHGFDNLVRREFLCDEVDAMVLSHWFKHHFQKMAPDLSIVLTVDSHAAMVSALKLGMGLGITASHLMWDEIRKGSMVPILTPTPNAINRISLVQLQDKVPTLTEKTFLSFVKRSMRKASIQKKFTRLSD